LQATGDVIDRADEQRLRINLIVDMAVRPKN